MTLSNCCSSAKVLVDLSEPFDGLEQKSHCSPEERTFFSKLRKSVQSLRSIVETVDRILKLAKADPLRAISLDVGNEIANGSS